MRIPIPRAMLEDVRHRILALTGAVSVVRVDEIQPLWNNYGTLCRVTLEGGEHPSAILKHIRIPQTVSHPRGFGGAISRQRKVRSYEVEACWYADHNERSPPGSPTPRCLGVFAEAGDLFLLLEDLGTRGFTGVSFDPTWSEIRLGLGWLARFHAAFLDDPGEGLWSMGTYWHLDTRPEELSRIEGTRLHRFAALLDARLRKGRHPTLVHGDAKLANFLFTPNRDAVAAVDFQYVGRGSAMMDVAYFVGSCLTGAECKRQEEALLKAYFDVLRDALPADADADAIESDWRDEYPIAWADFERFLLGWSPGHRKRTPFSDATTERALQQIADELLSAARDASLAAATFIEESRTRSFEVASKGLVGAAADVVTSIDLEAQRIILEHLEPTLGRYDLGLLAEESADDGSRLVQAAFWAIDPLDGTRFFVEGRPGYAVSVALVSRSGFPILGVVVDPVSGDCFEAVFGQGVTLNGRRFERTAVQADSNGRTVWFADESLMADADFDAYSRHFDLRFVGGAVINALHVMRVPNSVYVKPPKAERGGGAVWDFAAVALMLGELSGSVQTFYGEPLMLNREAGPYFNDVGVFIANAEASARGVWQLVHDRSSSPG